MQNICSHYRMHWECHLDILGMYWRLQMRYVLPLSRLDMHHEDRKKEPPTGREVTDGVANNGYDIGIQEL